MSLDKKSFFAFAAVFGVLGGVIAGYAARSWVEIGPSLPEARGAGVKVENLLASLDEKTQVSDAEYFYELTKKLEEDYVEPIPDKTILGTGAVRGMIASLADPASQFYDKEKWAIYQSRLKGKTGGIGADLELRYNEKELAKLRDANREVDQLLLIPDLFIASIAPGSPAAEAGLKAGDQIVGVNGSWVMSGSEIADLRLKAQKANAQEMTQIRAKMAKLADKNITPSRAIEVLVEQSSGSVELVARRAGVEKKDTLLRKTTPLVPAVDEEGGIDLNLIEGADSALAQRAATGGKLDLRGEIYGRSEMVVPILQTLIGGGTYGTVSREGGNTTRPITGNGAEKDASTWTVIVDEFTSGPALVIAKAMEARGAHLEGKTAHQPEWIESIPLVDGSGYTLVTGIFKAGQK
jgi:carboxyl-terminal processing protease